jgi:hypothetical protein
MDGIYGRIRNKNTFDDIVPHLVSSFGLQELFLGILQILFRHLGRRI